MSLKILNIQHFAIWKTIFLNTAVFVLKRCHSNLNKNNNIPVNLQSSINDGHSNFADDEQHSGNMRDMKQAYFLLFSVAGID